MLVLKMHQLLIRIYLSDLQGATILLEEREYGNTT